MKATIVYDIASRAQVIQPPADDLLTTLALLVGIAALSVIVVYLGRKLLQKRIVKEYHIAYKMVQPDKPAIARLRKFCR